MKFLCSFHSVVVADGYQVYNKISNEPDDLKITGCWSHACRQVSEAVKVAGLAKTKHTVAYMVP